MRVDLRTTWRRTRPGKSDERGRAWTIRILLRIRRLGVRVPPARHRFPRSRVGPSAAGSSSTASGRILATGELRPLYDTATEPGGGVVERAQ